MSIGERIAELRKEQNMSQGDLAEALDVTRQAVSKWENDLSSPDTIKLIQLSDVLDTDVEYLATGRRSYGRRPPVVLTETVEKVVEKPVYIEVIKENIVEKPVIQYIEKPEIQYVEKPVIRYVEQPATKNISRIRYVRNPLEFGIIALLFLILGILIGYFF